VLSLPCTENRTFWEGLVRVMSAVVQARNRSPYRKNVTVPT